MVLSNESQICLSLSHFAAVVSTVDEELTATTEQANVASSSFFVILLK